MNKKYIIKDSAGKYYTGSWREYWTRDVDQAFMFSSEEMIIQTFSEEEDEEGYRPKLTGAEFPLEQITIWL